ncbi:methylated-DNA--[protein]-cysteine S-methyltransferase [Neisseria animalis]|uniref:methylated-DNA--[protein]-cysteine S-methyltransferase n=1 Tax=Neisseria animalis TaxID=492 RepID=A0A5P3MT46_NEIAN|nr:methylated-DNA--[protein]-cysteine S-methyltransferase [Neisseria animalis]QEY24255.1 methylated-DNA--[protein]-cysteine S-methyltransferase [Neisseria animalis]ROW32339.1 methylated-DNA--[protein]-cysteine S-methyltransferase [Neisseria animalis]VEE06627.1 methylated-DNA--protein-cysteine methyltransferase [Neisseria animalis]
MFVLPSLETLAERWQPYRNLLESGADFPARQHKIPARDYAAFEQDFAAAAGLKWPQYRNIRRALNVLAQSNPIAANELAVSRIDTPLGAMIAVFAYQECLSLLEFVDQDGVAQELEAVRKALNGRFVWREYPVSDLLKQELDEYFKGRLQNFSVPLHFIGTAFQEQAWQVLQTIPYGETCTYKQQSEQLGNAKAVRAVAAANGQNKISIVVPCHRVIGSDGSLTGYAGGLFRKKYLLALEKKNMQTALFEADSQETS